MLRDQRIFGGRLDGQRVRYEHGPIMRVCDPIPPMIQKAEGEVDLSEPVGYTEYRRKTVWSLDGLVYEWWHPDLVRYYDNKRGQQ